MRNFQLDSAEYLAELSRGLADMAKAGQLPTAHLLFEMARMELMERVAELRGFVLRDGKQA